MELPAGNMKCFHPQTINDNKVSCGRCPACKQNRINGWVCRIERHARHQESAHFLTLTYADGQCSKTKKGLLTLDYKHVQHFFKTLRNLQNADYKKQCKQAKKYRQPTPKRTIKRFSYYVAGEYGSQTNRPHYHIIMFNASLKLISRAWGTNDHGRWIPRGNIHSGNITGGSIRYTLKYISKPSRLPLFEGDDRTPEFSHMSQGIGKDYLTPAIIKWHRADLLNRYYVPNAGGVQTTMPRYYANKIYTDSERLTIAEHLEKQQADKFYKLILQDESIIQQLLASQKRTELKAFQLKPSML